LRSEELDSNAARALQNEDYAMTTYAVTTPRHVSETDRFAIQSIVSPVLSTIGLFMSAFSEMQEARREAEKLHRFAED